MLKSKLQILNGTATRRTSLALSLLTGRTIEPLQLVDEIEHVFKMNQAESSSAPVVMAAHHHRRQYAARTVYLSERHLHDVDRIIEIWQQVDSKRLTRSAVLRRAIDYLRDAVEADPAKCTLEND
jgi:uncharacterized protein (DUF2384 family)